MTDFLQMNLFFLITSVAVIFITILLIVFLFRLIQITARIRDEIDLLRSDLSDLRQNLKQGGTFLKSLLGWFKNPAKRTKK